MPPSFDDNWPDLTFRSRENFTELTVAGSTVDWPNEVPAHGSNTTLAIIESTVNVLNLDEKPTLILRPYDPSFTEASPAGTLMSVFTVNSSVLEREIKQSVIIPMSLGYDNDHKKVQILYEDNRTKGLILQSRDVPWKQWYHQLQQTETEADDMIRGNGDHTDRGISTALCAAYDKLKAHQTKPEAGQVAPVLEPYNSERYAALEELFEIVKPALTAWNADHWQEEFDNVSGDKKKEWARLVSMVEALALSERHTHRHLLPDKDEARTAFGRLLQACRDLERLCLLNVNMNLFLDPADAEAPDDTSEVAVPRPWRTRSGDLSDDD
jgi:hypothetical protein